jgi:hypothetical protein
MLRPAIVLLTLSLAAAGCGHDKPPQSPKVSEVLPNIPLPPGASFVSKAGGTDAVQITVHSPARADVVAAYYRELFKREKWRLVNDAKDPEGAVVLFAEQDGPPIWIRIRGADDGRGTLVDIAGARVTLKHEAKRDSAAPSARPSS